VTDPPASRPAPVPDPPHDPAVALKARLDELVADVQLAPWACNCGEIHGEAATVREVRIPDPDSIPYWYMWTLEMTGAHGQRANWTTGLSSVLDWRMVEAMFAEYFPAGR
jgi:hypothetical protein